MNQTRRDEILNRYRAHSARFDQLAARCAGTAVATATEPHSKPSTGPPTCREVEILQLIANGLTNDQIAAKLVLSVETVKTHVRANLAKLQAHSRAHAVALGLRAGLVT